MRWALVEPARPKIISVSLYGLSLFFVSQNGGNSPELCCLFKFPSHCFTTFVLKQSVKSSRASKLQLKICNRHSRNTDCHSKASDIMTDTSSISIMTPQQTPTPHQFLPESQAFLIQSWARDVPNRPATPKRPQNDYQLDASTYSSSDPAIQAYLRLKLALLTKLH